MWCVQPEELAVYNVCALATGSEREDGEEKKVENVWGKQKKSLKT